MSDSKIMQPITHTPEKTASEAQRDRNLVGRENEKRMFNYMTEQVQSTRGRLSRFVVTTGDTIKRDAGKSYKKICEYFSGVWPDIDLCILDAQLHEVVMIISVKGSMGDAQSYATFYHMQNSDIPYVVITSDTKGQYKTGKSGYITQGLGKRKNPASKIYIAKMLMGLVEDDVGVTNTSEYAWNDFVQPLAQIGIDTNSIIDSHLAKNTKGNTFFEFEETNNN